MTTLLHDRLAQVASIQPDATAIIEGSRSVSYRELAAMSRRLARRVLTSHSAPGELVGICLPKSIEAIAAQFAVLEAGLAYAPLDVLNSPPQRLGETLLQAGVTLVVTTETLWGDLVRQGPAGLGDVGAIFVDGAEEADGLEPRPAPRVDLDDLAYVLFTSGSTGRPKGVMVSHRNALAFVDWAAGYVRLPTGTRFASHASLSFDLSVFDVYVCLAVGGTLHLVPPDMVANPRALLRWIEAARIECWYSVPSVWMAILRFARPRASDLTGLQRILFAGEVFPASRLAQLMALCPRATFHNLYGPTETNVCTCHAVTAASGDTPAPIGTACAGHQAYVLDAALREVADGEVGELFVGGPGVTPGYYRDPARTEAAFVQLPQWPGLRLYRTGDLVHRDAAGLLHFVGRKDHMVKIAGFRIELQDVEHTLTQHPSVAEAAVVPFGGGEETQGLAALVVARDPHGDPLALPLRAFLAERLPRYMTPDQVFDLDALPRNANGKLDRAACRELLTRLRAEPTVAPAVA